MSSSSSVFGSDGVSYFSSTSDQAAERVVEEIDRNIHSASSTSVSIARNKASILSLLGVVRHVDPILEASRAEPQKKSKKRERSGQGFHSPPRCHRHGVGGSSQPLSESLFGPSMRFSEYVSFNLSGPERQMIQSALDTNTALLAQVKEILDVHSPCDAKKEALKDEIAAMVVEKLSMQIEIDNLKREIPYDEEGEGDVANAEEIIIDISMI
ncbi:hypothetical protein VNO80_25382 [Phaseolus coccineus]|uniref:Uncharacterized protein n=1 Tax=Phaseolus coccineus TaxID=3886 RepID=A0AAN9LU63_PHACN